MSIPAYFEFFPHLLAVLDNESLMSLKEIREILAKRFKLSPEDLEELLPSGTQSIFHNRSSWALSYLKHAGFLESPKRATYRMTDIGKKWIQEHGHEITLDDLKRIPAFIEFIRSQRSSDKKDEVIPTQADLDLTPEAQIDDSMNLLNRQLSDDILEEILRMSPRFFEKLVLDLLYELGYGGKRDGAIISTPYSQDEGIDGLIKEDELGLDHVYVQAKRWQNPISRPDIQQFVGALSGQGAHKGVFITTSTFSKHAIEYANKQLIRVSKVN